MSREIASHKRRVSKAAALGTVALGAVLWTTSCGSDAETSGSSASGGATSDASTDGAGDGAAATGGSSGAGGGGATTGDAGPDANDCVHTGPPLIDPASLPECPLCENARCVPASLVPAESVDLLADCEDGTSKCVPDEFVATGGNFLLESCASLNDAEGRCVPLCVPQVANQADFLPQDICNDDERCAPCFDPRTGEDTGACSISCDIGPTDPPVTFDKCCKDLGSCVPKDVVPTDLQSKLGPDTCTGMDELCAPDEFADSSFTPLECRSVNDAEGRCIPECIPDVAAQASFLPKDICPDDHLCAPCFDPTTGDDTGSCTLNGDTPKEPPVTFDKCCNDLGACVPSALVPASQQSFLGPDTCAGTDVLCAPADLIDSTFIPPTCSSVNSSEGRCLPACLPAVAAQASQLPQDICAADHLCAPCYDPITGMDTGACTLNGDMPMNPPTTFDKCCGGIGSCVPVSLVPPSQQSLLGVDTCTMPDVLCAPDKLTAPGAVPAECRSIGNSEGRCLAECIPDVQAQKARLPQDSCDPGELCAPCYDPITGAATGACDINDDAPKEPPFTFEDCCGGIGSCVPPGVVPPSQQPLLGNDTCSNSGDLCAPDELTDTSFQPTECASINGYEGRCLPACLPDVAAQASRLPQDVCASTHLCAPCYDPITGADTGACTLNGDSPNNPPQTFEKCCSGIGSCVPPSIVPPAQQSLLGNDSCSNGSDLCAPDDLADPTFVPPTCVVWPSGDGTPPDEDFEGRCLPACLPDIAAQSSRLQQGSCATDHLCAPCWDPVTGADTGACSLNGDSPATPSNQNVFDKCCLVTGGAQRGVCVDDSLIPPADLGNVPVDTCSTGHHCVPDVKAQDPSAPFPGCNVGTVCKDDGTPLFGSAQTFAADGGVCMPECLLASENPDGPIPDAAHNGQRNCQIGEVCVACTLNTFIFDNCAGSLGSCNTGACSGTGDCPGQ